MWDEIDQNEEPNEQPGARAEDDRGAAPASSLSRGGSYYQVQQTLRLAGANDPGTGRRAFLFALVAWLPLVALAGAQGLAINEDPRRALLMDFTVYARFLVAIPLFIFGERVADNKYSLIVDYLVRSEIVPSSERQSYANLLSSVRRLRDSRVVEVLFIVIAFAVAGYAAVHNAMSGSSTWLSPNQGGARALSWAGAWYTGVSLPLFEFLLYRALWIWVLWCFFLWRLSRLDLRLMPTHPDQSGGLCVLGDSPYAIAIFVFAIGAALSSAWANQIIYNGASIISFRNVYLAYLLLILLIAFGPLLIFVGKLDRLRSRGMRDYGALVSRHAQLFDEKWIQKIGATEGIEESPLGNPDISSLADMDVSYEILKRLKLFPFDLRALIVLAVAAILPMTPLILVEIPLAKILRMIAHAFF
jgi:hypothetical protein